MRLKKCWVRVNDRISQKVNYYLAQNKAVLPSTNSCHLSSLDTSGKMLFFPFQLFQIAHYTPFGLLLVVCVPNLRSHKSQFWHWLANYSLLTSTPTNTVCLEASFSGYQSRHVCLFPIQKSI